MPKGPNGERRPGNVIGCAVMVAKIATRQIEDVKGKQSNKRIGVSRANLSAQKKEVS